MKLTFVQPAMGRSRADYVRSWQMEPLSVATLAGVTPPDVEVTFFDDRMEVIDYDAPTDLVALTAETYTAKRAYQIAREYRRRGVPVVLGGYHPTLVTAEAQLFADAVVVGDAEPVWPQVLADARRGRLAPLYRGERQPLDAVVTDRRIFAGKKYLPLTLIEAGRGCRFACNFCSIAAFAGHTYRMRPPEVIVREIEAAGRKRVFLVDDNLVAEPARAKELLRALAPLGVTWIGQASLQVADDPEMLDLLTKSGCAGLLIGFESLDEATLTAMNKRFNRGAARYGESIARLRDRGLKLYATFVFGYDEEAGDVFERTLDFALKQRFMIAAFNHLQPFPGTPLYEKLAAERRLLFDRWWLAPGYTFGQIAFRPTRWTAEELFHRLMQVRRRFFSLGSILDRSLDLRANANSPFSLWLHWTINLMLRREISQKWSLPVGDRSAAEIELPASA